VVLKDYLELRKAKNKYKKQISILRNKRVSIQIFKCIKNNVKKSLQNKVKKIKSKGFYEMRMKNRIGRYF
jgi:hypothetical protein